MFTSSRPLLFLEYFRIPCRASPSSAEFVGGREGHPLRLFETLLCERKGCEKRLLHWPSLQDGGSRSADLKRVARSAEYRIGPLRIYGHLVPDSALGPWLGETGSLWRASMPVQDARGRHVGSVWRSDEGSIVLPFDPDEIIRNFWSEKYKELLTSPMYKRPLKIAVRAYYRMRPFLPRTVQIHLRILFSAFQKRAGFPSWPIESSLHDFYELLLDLAASLTSDPIPTIAPWPGEYSWALVLTHDVETALGCENVSRVQALEAANGYRSSWNFVPKRYEVDARLIAELIDAHLEVGVHGLHHDGLDFDTLDSLKERIPSIRDAAREWGATGFRAPALQRVWEWMPLLGFDYDSSYPDTDPFGPVPGGCCTWLPYFNEELVELPVTLPQDHTLFVILRQADEGPWVDKTSFLRDRGGMALLITHPDYLADERLLMFYKRFLETFRDDRGAWKALPREVSAWWRRRAASHVEEVGGTWRIVGPAAGEGKVTMVGCREDSL